MSSKGLLEKSKKGFLDFSESLSVIQPKTFGYLIAGVTCQSKTLVCDSK